jgi:hypothetical protein
MRIFLRLFLLIIIFVFSLNTYSQRIMAGLIGGFNTTNVQGDDVYGFHKLGLNAGATAIVPFGDHWSLSVEGIYSQKGAYHAKGGRGMDYQARHDYNHYKLVLNYVEVPVLFHYIDRNWIKAGVGFSYGRLVEVKEWEDEVRVATTTLTGGPYDQNEYSGMVDVQFPLYRQLKFDFRYSFSLAKIRERQYYNVSEGDEKIRKQYNQVLSFRVFWIINEEASGRSRLR